MEILTPIEVTHKHQIINSDRGRTSVNERALNCSKIGVTITRLGGSHEFTTGIHTELLVSHGNKQSLNYYVMWVIKKDL